MNSIQTVRLFISIPTPASILPRLADVREILRKSRADVKWEPTEKLHCTIKFLGDTRDDLVQPLTSALRDIAAATMPFPVDYKGVGCFPGPRDPRIIWAGMKDPDGGLQKLSGAVEEKMSTLGFPRETRAFHPHVTLGRVKGTRNLAVLLGTMETVTLDNLPVMIHGIELVKSTLKPGGSVYTPVAEATFQEENQGQPAGN
jgi:RNA 2',3'-cyclic 3'-phosphodiesterase